MDLLTGNVNLYNNSVEDINMYIVDLFLPNIIIVGLYILIGIIGNSLVICVYLRKMGDTTDNRFFIPCLAAGDMLACLVCGTSTILLYVFHVEFQNEATCKVMWFSMTWSASSAALILVFIAFQRYKKICKPLHHSILMDNKVMIIVILYVSSLVVSSPLLFTAGITKLTNNEGNTTLYICERIGHDIRRGWRLHVALVYTGLESCIVLSIATVLSTLYMKVGQDLLQHFNLMNGKKKMNNTVTYDMDSTSEISTNKSSQLTSSCSVSKEGTLKRLKRKKESFNKKHRYTFIFLTISAICILTYSPRLILMILESADPNFWFNFYDKTAALRILKFLNRLHIVNNIANPFLYTMFDQKFKRQLLLLLKCRP